MAKRMPCLLLSFTNPAILAVKTLIMQSMARNYDVISIILLLPSLLLEIAASSIEIFYYHSNVTLDTKKKTGTLFRLHASALFQHIIAY